MCGQREWRERVKRESEGESVCRDRESMRRERVCVWTKRVKRKR